VTKGVTSYMDAYSKWDYTKTAMDDWAQLLRVRLDAAHGIKTETKKDKTETTDTTDSDITDG